MKFNTPTFKETHEGWRAIALDDKIEIIKLCLTSFMDNTFYESQASIIARLNWYIESIFMRKEPQFILKLAIFSRNYGLRSINHYLIAYWILKNLWVGWIRDTLVKVLSKMVRRPDEFWEILWAIKFINWGKAYFPMALKKAIKIILESGKFDEYQIAKYRNKWDLNLFDLVNLTHPKWEIFDKLMTGTLESADTWEVWLSTGWDKKEVFERQLRENKLWTKALLMNLRNMLQANVDKDLIFQALTTCNMKWIFPYEVLRALWYCKEEDMPKVLMDELEKIAYKSFENLPLEWRTAVLVDTSWSMQSRFNDKSTLECVDVASFYWALVSYKWYDVYAWATTIKKVEKWSGDSLLRVIQGIRNLNVWCGTDLRKAINEVTDYDNVIVFSDMQTSSYVSNTWKIKNLYLINLAPYEHSIATKWNMIEIAWFSDLCFKLAWDLKNPNNIIKEIDSIIII